MEPIVKFLLYSLLLVAVSFVGAYLPTIGKKKDGRIHLMISLSAGIFIGLLMFMLLPEGLEECEIGGINLQHAFITMAVGFLVIMGIEVIMKQHHIRTCCCSPDDHDHDHDYNMAPSSAFIGLAIHAACDGLSLAAMFMAGEETGLIFAVGLCVHKFVELFSLSSTMMLSHKEKKTALMHLGLFSFITPIAGLLFFLLFSGMEVEGMLGVPLMFAGGTLLYVVTCDIIPEAFHHEEHNLKSFLVLLLGVALMLAIAIFFPEV